MASCNMGMGNLAAPTTIFKRKFRWGLQISLNCKPSMKIDEYFVKVAARPNISFEETEINMKNAKMYIPGKATWESITVTFYDVVGQGVTSGTNALLSWIASVYDFVTPDSLINSACMGSAIRDYAATVQLNMYNGCGDVIERWTIKDAWPQAVNWNDLDYSSSEEATIECTIRYANVSFDDTLCGYAIEPCECTPCMGAG